MQVLYSLVPCTWLYVLFLAHFYRLSIHRYICGLHDTNVHVFLSQLTTAVNANPSRTALVIDSLSSLLLYLQVAVPDFPPVPTLCRWLHNMQPHVVLALIHKDLHEHTVLMQLDSIATSNLQVRPTAQPYTSQNYSGVVYTTHKKLSGKVLKQVHLRHVRNTLSFVVTCRLRLTQSPQPVLPWRQRAY